MNTDETGGDVTIQGDLERRKPVDSELVVIKTRLENFEKEIEELVRKKKQSKEYQDEASSCIGKVKEELDDTPRYRRRKLLGRYGKDLDSFLNRLMREAIKSGRSARFLYQYLS